MKKASHLQKDARLFFLVKVLKTLFIRFPVQGKRLANHSGDETNRSARYNYKRPEQGSL